MKAAFEEQRGPLDAPATPGRRRDRPGGGRSAVRRVILAALAATGGCVGAIEKETPGGIEGEGQAGEQGSTIRGKPGPQGASGGGSTQVSSAAPESCAADAPATVTPARRLTRREYANTVRDLLGVTIDVQASFSTDDEAVAGFDSNATAPVTPHVAEEYEKAARSIASRAKLGGSFGCDPASSAAPACVRQFVTEFGLRAYRRPLAEDEAQALIGLYMDKASRSHARAAAALLVEAMLRSPNFLYRPLDGAQVSGRPGTIQLDAYTLASRLSYMLLGTMPDAPLFEAARTGKLLTKDGIAQEVRRLLATDGFALANKDFHLQWLRLTRTGDLVKNPARFPAFTEEVRGALRAEAELFVDEVVRRGDGRIETLLTAPFTFATPALAQLYGVKANGQTGQPARIALDPTQRAGILTQVAFLAARASTTEASPVLRGVFVQEHVLCHELIPPNIAIPPAPPPSPNLTVRERAEQHRSNPACAGCHRFIEPVGFGFGHYDAIGRYQTMEAGKRIDASGEVIGTTDADGPFNGAVELAQRLAKSDQVRTCVATMWLRYATGRHEGDGDRCSLQAVLRESAKTGHRVPDLLIALATSDAFRFARLD